MVRASFPDYGENREIHVNGHIAGIQEMVATRKPKSLPEPTATNFIMMEAFLISRRMFWKKTRSMTPD
jgi:hypothetical protein